MAEDRNDKYHDTMTWREFLLYIGYDLNRESDLNNIRKDFEWLKEAREMADKKEASGPAFKVALFTTLLTTLLTAVISWLTK